MAQNVVIDIDASTKNFERSLDELTAKVKSTAEQMDKAFSVSGNAEKAVKNTSSAVNELGLNLKNISLIAAGNVLADGFEKAVGKIKKVGDEIYSTTKEMQGMQMALKGIVTSDLVKTGQVKDYTEATQKAEGETQKLLDWFKQLSLKSPYELTQVMAAFRTNANNGETVAVAKKTTEAILALGAGLGMGQAEMDRFSTALAQTAATGKMTQTDIRQFANNGFGMDKMKQIFDILSEKYEVVINDHNDFNKAIADGKFTTDAFFDAVHEFAMANYGGAVDAMASTIGGLISSMNDIKTNAINDLFLETSKTISSTLAPYVEYLMKLLTSGNFTEWGKNINQWVQGIIQPFQKIGETLENGRMMEAMAQIKDFFSGKGLNLGAVKSVMQSIMGENYNDEWFNTLWRLKDLWNDFLAHKDLIIDAIRGIGLALGAALSINMIQKLGGMIISVLSSPVTWLIAAGAAIGVAWNRNLFHIQERVAHVGRYITDLYKIFQKDGFTGVFEKLGKTATKAGNRIKDLWQNSSLDNIISFDRIETIYRYMSEIMSPMVQNARASFENIFNYGTELLNAFQKDGIQGVIQKVTEDINKQIETVRNRITETFSRYSTAFETDGVKGLFGEIGNDLRNAFSEQIPFIKGLLSELFGAEFVTNASNAVHDVFNWITTAIDDVRNTIHNVTSYFSDLGTAYNEGGIGGVFSKLWNDFRTWAEEAINHVRERFNELVPENVRETIHTIVTWIENIGHALDGIALGAGILILIHYVVEIYEWVVAIIGALPEIFAILGGVSGILSIIGELIATIVNPVTILIGLLAVGFSILGQFIDFGQLFVNIFNIIRDTVTNVINGIIENVVPRIRSLFETIQPLITGIGIVIGTVGTILATIFLGAGTLIVGAINGIISAIDNILAAVIDAIDFVINLALLPFDLIISLFDILVGVVTGDNARIEQAVQAVVDRIQHIWTAFQNFFMDLWTGLQDFLTGIWDVIVGVVNSFSIEDGLRRLFGEEVASRFAEIRDRVLGYIDEIRNAWQHMLGLLNGDIVVMDNGQEISGKTYEAFENNYSTEYLDKVRQAHSMGENEYADMYAETIYTWDGETRDTSKAREEYKKLQEVTEESLFDNFTRQIEGSIRFALSKGNDEEYAKSYLNTKYGEGFADDPFIQSIIDRISTDLGVNTTAIEENTASTETNTEAEKNNTKTVGTASNTGKPESSVSETNSNVNSFFKTIADAGRDSLLYKATEAIEKEYESAVELSKSYNKAAIDELKKASADEAKNGQGIINAVTAWLPRVGLEESTNDAITAALNSIDPKTERDELASMLENIVTVLETGNLEILSEIQTNTKEKTDFNAETNKLFDDIINSENKISSKDLLGDKKPLLEQLDLKDLGLSEEIKFGTEEQEKKLEEQNKLYTDALSKLDSIEKIEEQNDGEVTQKQMEEAKSSMLKIAEEVGASKEQSEKLLQQMEKANTPEQLAEMAKNFRETIEQALKSDHRHDWSYYLTDVQSNFYKEIAEMPEAIASSFQEAMIHFEPGEAFNMSDTYKSIEQSVGYINLLMQQIEKGRDFDEEHLQTALLGHFKQSGLESVLDEKTVQNINDILTANADTLSIDTLMAVASVIVDAVEAAGINVSTKIADKKYDGGESETKVKGDWNFFEQFMGAEWNRFYAQYETAIRTQMIEDGMSYSDMQKLSGAKAGSKDAEEWDKAHTKALSELIDAVNNGEVVNGFQVFDAKEMNRTYSPLLGERLNDVYTQLGATIDSFSTITSENFADAMSFITDSAVWQNFADKALFNSDIDPTETANQMFTLLEKLGANPEWVKDFKTDTTEALTKLSPEKQLELIQGLIRGVDGTIDLLNGDNTKALAAIEGAVKGGSSSYGKNNADVDTVKELYKKYNEATGDEKILYQDMIQGWIDVTRNGQGGTYAGFSVDMMNKDLDLWNNWIRDLSSYGVTESEDWNLLDRQTYYVGTHLQQAEEYEAEKLKREQEMEKLKELDPEKYAEMTKENKKQGILGMLFGEDFDLSELGSSMFSGLAESLDADTISNLQNLLGIEITEETVTNWLNFATALSTLGSANLQSALSEEIVSLLDKLASSEINENTVNGWVSLAESLSTVSTSLTGISGLVGILDMSQFAGIELPEDFLGAWSSLSGHLETAATSLMNLSGMTDILSMQSFSGLEMPETFLNAWSGLASSVEKVAQNLQIIQPIFEALQGLFGGGENGGGMTVGGGSSTTFEINGESGEGGGSGLFGMLFGTMDADTLAIVAEFLTPELLNAFLALFTTQIDQQIIDSWTLLSDQIERTSNAIIGMMVALTNGSEGELGDESAGDALVTAFTNLGAVAETVGPQIQNFLNPPLEKMREQLENILSNLSKICDVMKNAFPRSVAAFVPIAMIAIVATKALADAARAASDKYATLAAEIWNCVNALKALAELMDKKDNPTPTGGGNKGGGKGVGGPADALYAGGTPHFQYGTAIVGEHGPELITNNGSRAWQIFSNNSLMDEIAHTRHALNMLSNSAEYVAYNRIMGGASGESGTTDNSQNFTNNFNGNIIGDDAFRDMVEDTVREVWRREMNLAS